MTNVLYVFEKYYHIENVRVCVCVLRVFQEASEKIRLTRSEKSGNKEEEEMLPAAVILGNCSNKYVQFSSVQFGCASINWNNSKKCFCSLSLFENVCIPAPLLKKNVQLKEETI